MECTIHELSDDFHGAMVQHWVECGYLLGGFMFIYCGMSV